MRHSVLCFTEHTSELDKHLCTEKRRKKREGRGEEGRGGEGRRGEGKGGSGDEGRVKEE